MEGVHTSEFYRLQFYHVLRVNRGEKFPLASRRRGKGTIMKFSRACCCSSYKVCLWTTGILSKPNSPEGRESWFWVALAFHKDQWKHPRSSTLQQASTQREGSEKYMWNLRSLVHSSSVSWEATINQNINIQIQNITQNRGTVFRNEVKGNISFTPIHTVLRSVGYGCQ